MPEDGLPRLKRNLRQRVHELSGRIDLSLEEGLERVFQDRMDTYFTLEERILEVQQVVADLLQEAESTEDLAELRRIGNRLDHLEDRFDEMDSELHQRPNRRRKRRFNLSDFFRISQGGYEPRPSLLDDFGSVEEACRELGVTPGCDLRTLRRTFRGLLKELHPDVRGGDRSHEPRLRRLVAAYEFIKRHRATA
jgi:DnaJ-domain-containing protein 1